MKAQTVNQENIEDLFPERTSIKGAMARIRFDIKQLCLLRAPEFVEDLRAIHQEWPFDLVIHDVAFMAGAFIKQCIDVKTVSIGVVPLTESDDYLPPSGLGMKPMTSLPGRWVQGLMRHLVHKVVFRETNVLHNQLRADHGLPPESDFLFDSVVRTADVYLQSGVPDFEYPRKRISPNVRFVGPLLPYSRGPKRPFEHVTKALQYKNVVLVTQGTVERDVEKIIAPTLEAYKNDPETLVIATTGGSRTSELRDRYPQENLIIEDFIDFSAVMAYASVYVTNGGYGGVMLALKHNLPIVVAGVHEGKNEIAARIDYCQVGIDLKTETPKPGQIRRAIAKVTGDSMYRQNVRKMGRQFSAYNPNELALQYIDALLAEPAKPELAVAG